MTPPRLIFGKTAFSPHFGAGELRNINLLSHDSLTEFPAAAPSPSIRLADGLIELVIFGLRVEFPVGAIIRFSPDGTAMIAVTAFQINGELTPGQ